MTGSRVHSDVQKRDSEGDLVSPKGDLVTPKPSEVRVGLRGGGGVGMGVSGMVFVGLVLGCIEAKFCK